MIERLFKGVMGEVDSSPFAPRSKMIAPSVAAAGVTALGGVASNILGGIFGHSANNANIEMQRETNEQNYKIFKENQAWQEDMWNKQNEYNLPSNVVERLKAAGINPSAVFGNGSATPAGSVGSVNTPSMQAARVNPYQPTNVAGEAVNAYNDSMLANASRRKMDAEREHTETLNLFEQKSMASRLKSLQEMAKRDDYLGQIARTQLQFEQDSYYWRLKSLRNDVAIQNDTQRLNQQHLYSAMLQNGLYEVQLAYAPKLNEAQLKQYYAMVNQANAQIGLINANKLLSDQERLNLIEEKVGKTIENGLKGFDFEIKKAAKNYIIQQEKWRTEQEKWRTIDVFQNSGRGLGSTDRPSYQMGIGDYDDFIKYSSKFMKKFNWMK